MKKNNLPRANRNIKATEVRVVDQNGEMLGVLELEDALRKAKYASLDLVEVSPNAEPPVCKILDFGKFKYENQKKNHDARKKQKIVSLKEIKLRPNIDPHDFGIKLKRVIKFLESGDKVKISMRFRGREIANQEAALGLMKQVKEATEEIAKIEVNPKMEMRQLLMILAPKV